MLARRTLEQARHHSLFIDKSAGAKQNEKSSLQVSRVTDHVSPTMPDHKHIEKGIRELESATIARRELEKDKIRLRREASREVLASSVTAIKKRMRPDRAEIRSDGSFCIKVSISLPGTTRDCHGNNVYPDIPYLEQLVKDELLQDSRLGPLFIHITDEEDSRGSCCSNMLLAVVCCPLTCVCALIEYLMSLRQRRVQMMLKCTGRFASLTAAKLSMP